MIYIQADKFVAGYRTAYLSMLIAYSIKLAMAILLYIYMFMFNKRRDIEQGLARLSEKEVIELGMRDVTEIDNKGFRYVL